MKTTLLSALVALLAGILVIGCAQQSNPITTAPTPAGPKGVQLLTLSELLGGRFESEGGLAKPIVVSADVTPATGGYSKL